jgi:hypothetical protein
MFSATCSSKRSSRVSPHLRHVVPAATVHKVTPIIIGGASLHGQEAGMMNYNLPSEVKHMPANTQEAIKRTLIPPLLCALEETHLTSNYLLKAR